MTGERDLLFGIMAVQLGFVTPRDLVSAGAAWAADRSRGIRDRLEADGNITPERIRMLDALVGEAVRVNDDDAARALESLGGEQMILQSFGGSVVSTEAVTESTEGEDEERFVTPESPGRYRPPDAEAELGRGGMGRVLLAFDGQLGREIALKELLVSDEPSSASTAPEERFLREARVTAQLEHPSIVPVHELGRRADGRPYYTMKVVRGRTLSVALSDCKSLAERLELLSHFVDLCNAVAYAHDRGVVHRDLKPSNVMVGAFGETVVLDWGLAKVRGGPDLDKDVLTTMRPSAATASSSNTVEGDAIGTPAYMSPEQAEGDLATIDERSDVWGLGAVLYEILTGRPPFAGKNPFEVIGKVMRDSVEPAHVHEPDVPRELAAIAQKALSRERSARYASAIELAEEVQRYEKGLQVAAYQYSSWAQVVRLARRHRAVFAGAVIALAAIVVGLVATTTAYRGEVRSRQQANVEVARAYYERADRAIDEGDAVEAKLFAAASLQQNPSFEHGTNFDPDLLDTEAARAGRSLAALTTSILYDVTARTIPKRPTVVRMEHNADPTITLSPNARWAALSTFTTSNEHWLQVVDTASGEVVFEKRGLPRGMYRAAFGPDSAHVWTVTTTNAVELWRLEDKKRLASVATSGGRVSALVRTADGNLFVGTERGAVLVIDGHDKKVSVGHAGFGSSIEAIAAGPDGRFATSDEARRVRTWTYADGRLVANGAFQARGESKRQVSLEWAHGHILRLAVLAEACLLDAERLTEVTPHVYRGVAVRAASFDPSQPRVAFAIDRTVAIVTLDGRFVGSFERPFQSGFGLQFSADGGMIYATSLDYVSVVDTRTFAKRARYYCHDNVGHALTVSADGRLLACTQSGRVWFIGLEPPQNARRIGPGRTPFTSRSRKHVIMGAAEGNWGRKPVLWRVTSDELVELDGPPSAFSCIDETNGRIVTSHPRAIYTFDLKTGAKLAERPMRYPRVACLPTRGQIAVRIRQGVVIVDVETLETIIQRRLDGAGNRIAASPDDKTLATVAAGGRVIELSADDLSEVGSYQIDEAGGADYSPDGRLLAVGCVDGTVATFDRRTKTELWRLKRPRWVNTVAYSPDGRYLATAEDERSSSIIDAETGELRLRIGAADWVPQIAWLDEDTLLVPDGPTVRAFDLDFSAWQAKPAEIIRDLEKNAGIRLVDGRIDRKGL